MAPLSMTAMTTATVVRYVYQKRMWRPTGGRIISPHLPFRGGCGWGLARSGYDRTHDCAGRDRRLDRQVIYRLKALLSAQRQDVRGEPELLRQPVLAGRGGLHLLRDAEAGEL